MGLFRRSKQDSDGAGTDEDQIADAAVASEGADNAPEVLVEPARPTGPWDIADCEALDDTWVDLGSLRMAPAPGVELRLEVERGTERVIALTIVAGDGQVQVQVFAAPRRSGLWGEIRAEIVEGIRQAGGTATEEDGRFGVEIAAKVPSQEKKGTLDPGRFVGVDGPRWFVRAVFSGAAARAGTTASTLEEAFAGLAVVRGSEAMAPRDPLPMHLPGQPPMLPPEPDGPPTLTGLKRRGPEITEIR